MGMALEKLPHWPAAMSRDLALAYTGVADSQMREWESRGLVRFAPRGPRGASIVPRTDLDAALELLFGAGGVSDPIEFDD
ncbi:hypothetical protein [Sphingomonas sp. NIC1]|uniref:hypothetical protein n=1 Tax=Sphingomonas sp. NIC1 TaxID=1961362 RepID=UPI0007C0D3B2|nr:hypothetical protein [Sphingomonas sp. NIC1]ANC88243.1 hypothetical protein A7E77_00605 [Sphingomonas sp. NIC1]